MRFLIVWLVFIILLCSCRGRINSVTRIQKGDTILEGKFDRDSFLNGEIKYFLKDSLISIRHFDNNILNGLSVDFYSNGRLMMQTVYSDGLKNGENSYYDTGGKIQYKDFYYFDLVVGPILYFDSLGQPRKYYFSNLQNETLIYIDYQDWHGIRDIFEKCINFTENLERIDSTEAVSLLLYLPSPPKMNFDFGLYNRFTPTDSFHLVESLPKGPPFKQITLHAPRENEQYAVGLVIYDSIFEKKSIIFKEFGRGSK